MNTRGRALRLLSRRPRSKRTDVSVVTDIGRGGESCAPGGILPERMLFGESLTPKGDSREVLYGQGALKAHGEELGHCSTTLQPDTQPKTRGANPVRYCPTDQQMVQTEKDFSWPWALFWFIFGAGWVC